MKGICYPAFIRELGENFLTNLREVAGSSAGAIIAFLVASGVDMETAQDFIANVNIFKEINGDIDENRLGTGLFGVGRFMQSMNNLSIREPQRYYAQIKDSGLLSKIAHCKGYEKFIVHADNGFHGGLTFNDLYLLHQLNPAKFKQLYITAYDRKNQELRYFNAESDPDFRCFIGLRASIAIPHIIKPILIDGRELSDGGEGSNVPLEVFSQRADFDPEETAVFIFDRQGTAFRILHEPPKIRGRSTLQRMQRLGLKAVNDLSRSLAHLDPDQLIQHRLSSISLKEDGQLWHSQRPSLLKRILGGENYVKAMRRDGEKIVSMLSNAFVIPHGDLSMVSFNASKKMIQQAIQEAASAGREYASWRKGMASYRVYPSGRELLDKLTESEKNALIQAGLPSYAKQRVAEYLETHRQFASNHLKESADLLLQETEANLEPALECLRHLAKETNRSHCWTPSSNSR